MGVKRSALFVSLIAIGLGATGGLVWPVASGYLAARMDPAKSSISQISDAVSRRAVFRVAPAAAPAPPVLEPPPCLPLRGWI